MMPPELLRLFVAFGGALVGTILPDVDQVPAPKGTHLWAHRSVWTHGALFPAALWLWASASPWGWWFAIGCLPTLALHLIADMLPRQWRGGAMINLAPLPGSLPMLLSLGWLAVGVWASTQAWALLVAPYAPVGWWP